MKQEHEGEDEDWVQGKLNINKENQKQFYTELSNRTHFINYAGNANSEVRADLFYDFGVIKISRIPKEYKLVREINGQDFLIGILIASSDRCGNGDWFLNINYFINEINSMIAELRTYKSL